MDFALGIKIAILSSGIFLLIGMCTGVWKYIEIRKNENHRAHYYIDIAHRASLLYAPACLILAVLGYFSIWLDFYNNILIILNIIYFLLSVLSYIFHGFVKDTKNQFQKPHVFGKWSIPPKLMTCFMFSLIVIELMSTALLCLGTMLAFF